MERLLDPVDGAVDRPRATFAGQVVEGVRVDVAERRTAEVVLRSVRVLDAAALTGDAFSGSVHDAYRLLLRAEPRAQIVRAWNFVPDIRGVSVAEDAAQRDPQDDSSHAAPPRRLDRYMLFNTGRAAGFNSGRCRDGAGTPTSNAYPAATGVGHAGRDFVVHGLFIGSDPNRAPWLVESIENPRQVPAWSYSPRWGPIPPSFTRATRLRRADRSVLLVSGTASVRGEASCHEADVTAQFAESVENLRCVVRSACGDQPAGDPLERFRSIRVYVPHTEDLPTITAALERSALACAEREIVVAPLCREELLVEIEGVVAAGDGRADGGMEVFSRADVDSREAPRRSIGSDAGEQP